MPTFEPFLLTEQTNAHYTADCHCPACGNVWARMPSRRSGAEFYPLRKTCSGCRPPWGSEPAGSLYFDPSGLRRTGGYDHLPRALLLREMVLEVLAVHTGVDMGGESAHTKPIAENLAYLKECSQMDKDTMMQIMQLRVKQQNEGLSDDELRQAVVLLREGRSLAASRATAAKAPKAKVDGASVLALFN